MVVSAAECVFTAGFRAELTFESGSVLAAFSFPPGHVTPRARPVVLCVEEHVQKEPSMGIAVATCKVHMTTGKERLS